MKYLDLTTEQAQAFAAGQMVEVWERMEPQPPAHARELHLFQNGTVGYRPIHPGVYMAGEGGWHALMGAKNPHPPGTRAIVQTGTPTQAGGVTVRVGAIVRAISTTTRPEQRDDWGFATGWVKA